MLVIKGKECKENGLKKEWSEANINGSYIYNNLLCYNTKLEHSMLAILLNNKWLSLVASLNEKAVIDKRVYILNRFKELNEKKQDKERKNYLNKFYIDYNPNFIYDISGQKLTRSILLVHDRNITVVKYSYEGKVPIQLEISPLIVAEEHFKHKTDINLIQEEKYIKILFSDKRDLFIYFNSWKFNQEKKDFINEELKKKERYISPGIFSSDLTLEKKECFLGISAERIGEDNIKEIFNREIDRRKTGLTTRNIKHKLYQNIILSTDFYIKKEKDMLLLKNALSEQHISFQTLINSLDIFLVMRRPDSIKDLLKYLINNNNKGIIPEFFNKETDSFIYNSLDNSFWYLLFILKYIEYTGDWKFVKDFLWEKIKLIMHNFYNNHIPEVKIDFDGLLVLNRDINNKFSRNKIIEYLPGKNIALNCLWYNAVRIMELLSAKFADIEYHTRTEEIAFIIKKNFFYKFWDKEKEYMDNRIDIPPDKNKDDSLRPYQIFICSLPYSDLVRFKTKRKILKVIEEKLLTPYGLMTLSADSKNFIGQYNSDKPESAYNGIIHPYLLFHYITAYMKLNKYSKAAKKQVKSWLVQFEKIIKQNKIGFFPQQINTEAGYSFSGYSDYSLTLSSYLKVQADEIGSL